ncbi:PREDICTED: 30S ribosomal protein S3-like [Priapulus caudatus]|uniref:30S ribosomal protein S3-like n=1 Tax=Priapulus caudatus TaxID=37621 RepID=A0ABM1F5M4_PRICU|nr:PREDICTED: 30S ribosomal protein S3-like [Priapulus caudatus]
MAAGRTNSRFLHPAGASVAAATRKSSSRVGTKPTKQTTSVSNTRAAAAAAAAAGGGGMASAASVPAGIRGKSPSSSPLSKQAKPASLSTAARKPSPQKTAAANTNNKNLPAATKKR